MKITISAGDTKIERNATPAQHPSLFSKAPLRVRRERVRELVAMNRRSRFRLIAGGKCKSPDHDKELA